MGKQSVSKEADMCEYLKFRQVGTCMTMPFCKSAISRDRIFDSLNFSLSVTGSNRLESHFVNP